MATSLLARVSRTWIFPRTLAQKASPPLLNDALQSLRRVRLISESGEDCGEMTVNRALQHAKAAGRDLMQVSAGNHGVAVVRVVDYEEWHTARQKSEYDARKRRKESKLLNRREGILKQIRLSPATDWHDRAIKVRQAREFLSGGYRVRVYMQFRRGHGRLQEDAKGALIEIAKELQSVGKVQGVTGEEDVEGLFKKQEKEEEEEEEGEAKQKKPLEVVVFPLPRKQREQLSKGEAEGS